MRLGRNISRIQRLLFEICLDGKWADSFLIIFFSRNVTYHSTALRADVRIIRLKIKDSSYA